MGQRGPVAKRSDMRVRRNKPESDGGVPLSKGVAHGFSAWTPAGVDWDESVIRLYESFKNTGMVNYYEQTDIELIWQSCDQLNEFRQGRRGAQGFDFIMKHLHALGASEEARRRMRIELVSQNDEEDETPELALVTDIRSKVGGKKTA